MSADNWAICPKCAEARARGIQAVEIDVANAYGEVAVEAFDAMRADLEALRNAEPERTFREDYEIWGAEEGVVRVSYSGGCNTCGAALKFTHEHEIEIGATR